MLRIVPWMAPLFRDRAEAGRLLADAVAAWGFENSVVVGVARGGVAVALEVARGLRAPLTAVDVERVNSAGSRVGAVTADGPAYLTGEVDEAVVGGARRKAEALEARLEHEQLPVARRVAVVVDDGLITGFTLAAACRWARSRDAARVVAATPVARAEGLSLLEHEADDVVCPNVLEEIVVVGQAYDSFDTLDEWYVAGLLQQAERGE